MNESCGREIKLGTQFAPLARFSFRMFLAPLVTVFFVSACVTHGDVGFLVAGTVTTKGGEPLSDVEVTLQLGSPVYEGITPVKEAHTTTDGGGKFRF